MPTEAFDRAFATYVAGISAIASKSGNHDHRRHLFLDFLKDGFGIHASELEIEPHIAVRVAEIDLRGFIDTLYERLIVEFKCDLPREREVGIAELKKYFLAKPGSAFGFVTDGVDFEVYRPDHSGLEKIDHGSIASMSATEALYFFDRYLMAQHQVIPDSANVVSRFGELSPTFLSARDVLRSMWTKVKSLKPVETKYSQWKQLLSKVYGAAIDDEELFLRHTYLSAVVKCIAFAALFPKERPAGRGVLDLITGAVFRSRGYNNVVDEDFFSWILISPVQTEATDLITILDGRLRRYDLTKINEDLLKELYQNLIGAETRQSLGEFYTPDWLATKILLRIGFGKAVTDAQRNSLPLPALLDPACGSGTFLFTAICIARENGVTGDALVEYAFSRLMGIDVHPLATIIARVNFCLALNAELSQYKHEVYTPIFMADSIQPTEPMLGTSGSVIRVGAEGPLPTKGHCAEFRVPVTLATNRELFDQVMETMELAASRTGKLEDVAKGFWRAIEKWSGVDPAWRADLVSNCKVLARHIRADTDSIWGFVVRNCAQPAYVSQNKVDFVVGNPPWLAYNRIKHPLYQDQVKRGILKYGLLAARDAKLFTQMDLSTLFFEHCREEFLKANGTIAFVMPKSVLSGAQQHAEFRKRGCSYIIDCSDVGVALREGLKQARPLFPIPACAIVVDQSGRRQTGVAVEVISGVTPTSNLQLSDAEKYLTTATTVYNVPAMVGPGSVYQTQFRQGATILPRAFWFPRIVKSAKRTSKTSTKVALETDPGALAQAKKPWKTCSIRGAVEPQFVFATLSGDELVPFGVLGYTPVVLPVRNGSTKLEMLNESTAAKLGYVGLADWISQAQKLWNKNKTSKAANDLENRVDYQKLLTSQAPTRGWKVIYNKSGTNIAAAVVSAKHITGMSANGHIFNGFFADTVTYLFSTRNQVEAHYLCGVLNSLVVNAAIKPHQSIGEFGARDIHLLPFRVLPIPAFDIKNTAHVAIAKCSAQCHRVVNGKSPALLALPIKKRRAHVRSNLCKAALRRIDRLVDSLLIAESKAATPKPSAGKLF